MALDWIRSSVANAYPALAVLTSTYDGATLNGCQSTPKVILVTRDHGSIERFSLSGC
ncbi:hypothetical protein GCM10025298_31360 [Natronobiforma cellulositropha]